MQDEAGVDHLADRGARLLFEEHVIEVAGVVEVVAGHDRFITVAEAMEGCHHRGELGDEPHRRVPIALLIGDVARGIKHAHGSHRGLQSVHGMAVFGQAFDEVFELVLDAAMMAQLIVKVGQLPLRR